MEQCCKFASAPSGGITVVAADLLQQDNGNWQQSMHNVVELTNDCNNFKSIQHFTQSYDNFWNCNALHHCHYKNTQTLHWKLQTFWVLVNWKLWAQKQSETKCDLRERCKQKTFDLILSCVGMNDDSAQSHSCTSRCCHRCQWQPASTKENRTSMLSQCCCVLHGGHERTRRLKVNRMVSVGGVVTSFLALLPMGFLFQQRKAWEWMTLGTPVIRFPHWWVKHEGESRIPGLKGLALALLGNLVHWMQRCVSAHSNVQCDFSPLIQRQHNFNVFINFTMVCFPLTSSHFLNTNSPGCSRWAWMFLKSSHQQKCYWLRKQTHEGFTMHMPRKRFRKPMQHNNSM